MEIIYGHYIWSFWILNLQKTQEFPNHRWRYIGGPATFVPFFGYPGLGGKLCEGRLRKFSRWDGCFVWRRREPAHRQGQPFI